MDIIEMTRKLGAELQKDERYTAYREAVAANDADKELNDLIGEFNLIRVKVNTAASGDKSDPEKTEKLNAELRECYDKIMNNPNMMAFESAKTQLDNLVKQINGIITMSVNGEDPMTCQVPDGCSGSCSTCGGCG